MKVSSINLYNYNNQINKQNNKNKRALSSGNNISFSGDEIWEYTHGHVDNNGNTIITKNYPNGAQHKHFVYTYNKDQKLTSKKIQTMAYEKGIDYSNQETYEYDSDGDMTKKIVTNYVKAKNSKQIKDSLTLKYDKLQNIVEEEICNYNNGILKDQHKITINDDGTSVRTERTYNKEGVITSCKEIQKDINGYVKKTKTLYGENGVKDISGVELI